MIASDPWSVFDLSLRLSVAAVGGLLLFGDLVGAWISAAIGSLPGSGGRLLGATVTAQAATLPVVAPAFNVISVVAPAANLVAVPATTLALPVALLGVVLLTPMPGIGMKLLEGSALLFGCAHVSPACAQACLGRRSRCREKAFCLERRSASEPLCCGSRGRSLVGRGRLADWSPPASRRRSSGRSFRYRVEAPHW